MKQQQICETALPHMLRKTDLPYEVQHRQLQEAAPQRHIVHLCSTRDTPDQHRTACTACRAPP